MNDVTPWQPYPRRAPQKAVEAAAETLLEHMHDSAESWNAQDPYAVALTLSRLMLESALDQGYIVAIPDIGLAELIEEGDGVQNKRRWNPFRRR